MAQISQDIKTPNYYSVAYWRKWARLYDRTTSLAFLLFGGEKRFRRKFVAMAGLKDTDHVLDICCGTGSTTAIIAEEVQQGKIIGVDLSPDMIAVARKKVPAQWVGFERASVDALPFADNSFNAVLCTYGLHEIPKGVRAAALNEVFRVLKPGGKFMTMDYGLPSHFPARQAISTFVRIFEHDIAYQMMKGDLAGEVGESGLRVLSKKGALRGMFQIIESIKE